MNGLVSQAAPPPSLLRQLTEFQLPALMDHRPPPNGAAYIVHMPLQPTPQGSFSVPTLSTTPQGSFPTPTAPATPQGSFPTPNSPQLLPYPDSPCHPTGQLPYPDSPYATPGGSFATWITWITHPSTMSTGNPTHAFTVPMVHPPPPPPQPQDSFHTMTAPSTPTLQGY